MVTHYQNTTGSVYVKLSILAYNCMIINRMPQHLKALECTPTIYSHIQIHAR